jgi:hypothetical protein
MKRLILILLLAKSFAIGPCLAQISGGGGGSGATVAWGSVTGTLSNQTDLNTALIGKQPVDPDLTAIAALATTSYGRSILAAADAASAQSILSLVPGTNVQPFNANLTTYSGITPSTNTQTFLGAANYAAMRTQLGLVIGTNVQAFNTGLTQIAALLDPNANRILIWNDSTNSYDFASAGTGLSLGSGTLAIVGSSITGIVATQVAFQDNDNKFAATDVEGALEELNDVNPSGPNAANGKVSWTQLVNVPSGFADGVDNDTGGGAGTDTSAIHVNVANEISGITLKATPAAADKMVIEDSVAANVKKSASISSLATPLAGILNLSSLQGSVTDAQVPDTITVNLAATATTALNGDSATGFFPTGAIERARGGTGVDTSGMGVGLFGSDAGNAFVDVDTIGELETMIGGTNILTPTELDSAAEFSSVLSVTGTPSSTTYLRGDWTWGTIATGAGGADTQIQFNDGGALAGSTGLTYNKTTGLLSVTTINTTNLNATSLTFTGAMVLPDGVRQTFNPNATTPGLNVGAQAGDPSTPTNGDLWYDSTGNLLRARINGATVSLGAGGGGTSADSLVGTHATPSTTTPLSPTWTSINQDIFYGVAGTINLPAASGMAGHSVVIYNTGAFLVTIDPSGSDIVVRGDGTVQGAGVAMTLSSGAGNYVKLLCDGARWVTLDFRGTLSLGAITVSDNFDRADSSTLGPNWTSLSMNMQIISGAASATAGNENDLSIWTANTFGPNQFSTAKLDVVSTNNLAVYVRTGAGTGYGFEVTATTWRLFRNDTDANLASGSATFSNGDTFGIQVSGTTITCQHNGSTINTTTSSLFSSGAPGIGIFRPFGASSPRLEDWSGGDL